MCGIGSGKQTATHVLKSLTPFFESGGTFSYVGLESIFSRTYRGCPKQKVEATAAETAGFAAELATKMTNSEFFLYDALPHFSVATWSANSGFGKYGLDLHNVLTSLQKAMTEQKVKLSGYWMDCPFEYSRDYPNSTQPLAAGSGFKKVGAAVQLVKQMGLQVGKTINSQQGGATSDERFYTSTMDDYTNTTAVTPAKDFDFLMIESWYPHPLQAAPETTQYTTTFTALAVMSKVANDLGPVSAWHSIT